MADRGGTTRHDNLFDRIGLPDGVDDAAVAARALAAGVAVQPLSYHRLRPGRPGLVIGYAAVTPDRLRVGVRLLAAAVRASR